jgi:hypothetical protein
LGAVVRAAGALGTKGGLTEVAAAVAEVMTGVIVTELVRNRERTTTIGTTAVAGFITGFTIKEVRGTEGALASAGIGGLMGIVGGIIIDQISTFMEVEPLDSENVGIGIQISSLARLVIKPLSLPTPLSLSSTTALVGGIATGILSLIRR